MESINKELFDHLTEYMGYNYAVVKESNEIVLCDTLECEKCKFYEEHNCTSASLKFFRSNVNVNFSIKEV